MGTLAIEKLAPWGEKNWLMSSPWSPVGSFSREYLRKEEEGILRECGGNTEDIGVKKSVIHHVC